MPQLKNRLARKFVSPERVADIIDDVLLMLRAGVGQIGLDPGLLDYLESQLDVDELAAMLTPRIWHILRIDDA